MNPWWNRNPSGAAPESVVLFVRLYTKCGKNSDEERWESKEETIARGYAWLIEVRNRIVLENDDCYYILLVLRDTVGYE